MEEALAATPAAVAAARPQAQRPAEVSHALTIKQPRLAAATLDGRQRLLPAKVPVAPGWYAIHIAASGGGLSDEQKRLLGTPPAESSQLARNQLVGAVQVTHAITPQQASTDRWWAASGSTSKVALVVVARGC